MDLLENGRLSIDEMRLGRLICSEERNPFLKPYSKFVLQI